MKFGDIFVFSMAIRIFEYLSYFSIILFRVPMATIDTTIRLGILTELIIYVPSIPTSKSPKFRQLRQSLQN